MTFTKNVIVEVARFCNCYKYKLCLHPTPFSKVLPKQLISAARALSAVVSVRFKKQTSYLQIVVVVSTSKSNDNLYRELSQKNRFLQRTEHGFQCANSQSVSDKNLVL